LLTAKAIIKKQRGVMRLPEFVLTFVMSNFNRHKV